MITIPVVEYGHEQPKPTLPEAGELFTGTILVASTGGEPDWVRTDGCQFRPDGAADAFVDLERMVVTDAQRFYALVAEDIARSVAGDDVRHYARNRGGLTRHRVRATHYRVSFERSVITELFMRNGVGHEKGGKGRMRETLRRERCDMMVVDAASTTGAYDRAYEAGVGTPVMTATMVDSVTLTVIGKPGGFSTDDLADLVSTAIMEAGADRRLKSIEFDVTAS